MSSLNPKPEKTRINGIEYGIYFPLRAVDTIQDKYDITINAMQTYFNDQRKCNRFLAFVLETLIFEANDLIKEQTGTEPAGVTAEYIYKRILPLERVKAIDDVYKAFASGAPELDGDAGPNAEGV
jgi:hypothetical protein